MKNIFFIIILSMITSACFSSKPPELRSPCVALDSNDASAKNPCVRRPANAHLIG